MNFNRFLVALAALICVWHYAEALELDGINCKVLAEKLGIKNIHVEHLYFPHEDDCGSFYHCGTAGASKKACGLGTIFSMKHKECRLPENARCISLDKFLERKDLYLDDFYEEDY